MTKEKLISALKHKEPSEFSMHEKTLWYAHQGQWEEAHELIQSGNDAISSLIHGYLHHVEGDHCNGDYWYRRSGFEVPKEMEAQWEFILQQVAEE